MSSQRISFRGRIITVTRLRQNAQTAAERERYTRELIELINTNNGMASQRREKSLRKLLMKKPSKTERESGVLSQLRQLLQETFEIQQLNDPKIARLLLAILDDRSDQPNKNNYRQMRRLLSEASLTRRLRQYKTTGRRKTRPATDARREIGERTLQRIRAALEQLTSKQSDRATADKITATAATSTERARKLLPKFRGYSKTSQK